MGNHFKRYTGIAVAGLIMVCLTASAIGGTEFLVVDMLMGEPVPTDMLMEDLSQVRVVYIGEVHTIARHHDFQKALLEGMAQRHPRLALGMEIFTERQQPDLDRWQHGEEDLDALTRSLGEDRWTNQQDYSGLLLAARRLQVPIVGLNAPGRLVRKVAREGLESLSAEELRDVPENLEEQINPMNDRLLRMRLKVHKAFQGKSLDRIILAQTLRDDTMARAIVRFLTSPEGKDRIMLVVAGNGHVNYGFGIPELVRRRLEVPFRIVLASESGELVLSEEDKRRSIAVTITHEDLRFIRNPVADYLHVVPLRNEDPQGSPPVQAHSSE